MSEAVTTEPKIRLNVAHIPGEILGANVVDHVHIDISGINGRLNESEVRTLTDSLRHAGISGESKGGQITVRIRTRFGINQALNALEPLATGWGRGVRSSLNYETTSQDFGELKTMLNQAFTTYEMHKTDQAHFPPSFSLTYQKHPDHSSAQSSLMPNMRAIAVEPTR